MKDKMHEMPNLHEQGLLVFGDVRVLIGILLYFFEEVVGLWENMGHLQKSTVLISHVFVKHMYTQLSPGQQTAGANKPQVATCVRI